MPLVWGGGKETDDISDYRSAIRKPNSINCKSRYFYTRGDWIKSANEGGETEDNLTSKGKVLSLAEPTLSQSNCLIRAIYMRKNKTRLK